MMKGKQSMKKLIVGALAAVLSNALTAAPSPDYATRDIFTDGEFFVGCNYWAKNAGMYMWSSWSPETVENEIAALAKYGTCVLRVFPLWPDFQPFSPAHLCGRSIPHARPAESFSMAMPR